MLFYFASFPSTRDILEEGKAKILCGPHIGLSCFRSGPALSFYLADKYSPDPSVSHVY